MFSKIISILSMTPVFTILLVSSVANIQSADAKGETGKAASHDMNSPEMKKDMADMYHKMADCMLTEKSGPECQKEMMKDCAVAKATGHCPVMDGMQGMKGMMGNPGMKHGNKEHNKTQDMNMESTTQ